MSVRKAVSVSVAANARLLCVHTLELRAAVTEAALCHSAAATQHSC
jgi:hypothetical protein